MIAIGWKTKTMWAMAMAVGAMAVARQATAQSWKEYVEACKEEVGYVMIPESLDCGSGEIIPIERHGIAIRKRGHVLEGSSLRVSISRQTSSATRRLDPLAPRAKAEAPDTQTR